MKPYQIFASMAPEGAEAFFRKLGEDQPAMLQQAAAAAAAALKSRPSYVLKLPIEKQGPPTVARSRALRAAPSPRSCSPSTSSSAARSCSSNGSSSWASSTRKAP